MKHVDIPWIKERGSDDFSTFRSFRFTYPDHGLIAGHRAGAAKGLIDHGASVILNGRDRVRLAEAAASLKAETSVSVETADFDVPPP